MSVDKNFGLYVKVTDPSDPISVDKAIKKLKKKVKKSNLMIDLYDSMYFKKPSEKKREKKRKALARNYYKVKQEHDQEGAYL